MATSLTRANIYDAIKAHRVYATENRNLKIFYEINGKIMGSIISAGICNVSIHVEDPNTNISNDRISKIELIRNGENVVDTHEPNAYTVDWTFTIEPCSASYYFVRVTNAANQKAWTAPIWVTTTQYTLVIDTVGRGSVSRQPDQASYHYGDAVTLTAAPDPGWTFGGWSGDLPGSADSAMVTLDSNKTVTATFTPEWMPISNNVIYLPILMKNLP